MVGSRKNVDGESVGWGDVDVTRDERLLVRLEGIGFTCGVHGRLMDFGGQKRVGSGCVTLYSALQYTVPCNKVCAPRSKLKSIS
jgi:hypothetical protein